MQGKKARGLKVLKYLYICLTSEVIIVKCYRVCLYFFDSLKASKMNGGIGWFR